MVHSLAVSISLIVALVVAHQLENLETRKIFQSPRDAAAQFRPLAGGVYVSHRHEPLLLANKKREDYIESVIDLVTQKEQNAAFRILDDHYEGTNGVRHVYLKQTHNGVDIANADMNVNVGLSPAFDQLNTYSLQVGPDGSIVSFGSSFVKGKFSVDSEPLEPESALRALEAVADKLDLQINVVSAAMQKQSELKYTFDGSEWTASAEFKYYKMPNQGLKPVWMVLTFLSSGWRTTFVSAVSPEDIVASINHVRQASYEVYPWGTTNPEMGEREILVDPWDINASKFTWQGDGHTEYNTTWGNNVAAQENWNATLYETSWPYKNNYRPSSKKQHFVYPYNPATKQWHQYINASITQLFYTVNMYHDVLYRLGFNESTGNYQINNGHRGGQDGDFIIAFSQDQSRFSNGEFWTSPDGRPAHLRMFMWNRTVPYRDGIFDNTILLHELTHGVTNRLAGGPSQTQCLVSEEAFSMDEGWADAFATAITIKACMNRTHIAPIGAWVWGDPQGDRRYPYSTDMSIDPWTYGDSANLRDAHTQGEIWASMLYDLFWDLVDKHGIDDSVHPTFDSHGIPTNGRFLWMKLIVDGLSLGPCNPSASQARDAIIDADFMLTGGQNECLIWKAFARRGLGTSATSYGILYDITYKESFDIPDDVCY